MNGEQYLVKAAGLALFMISAGTFGTLLEYPQSALRGMLPDRSSGPP